MSSKRVCPNCGRKMKQQFIGLFHCKCGLSWKRDIGFFERTPNMVFALERIQAGKKVKQVPVIIYTSYTGGLPPYALAKSSDSDKKVSNRR